METHNVSKGDSPMQAILKHSNVSPETRTVLENGQPSWIAIETHSRWEQLGKMVHGLQKQNGTFASKSREGVICLQKGAVYLGCRRSWEEPGHWIKPQVVQHQIHHIVSTCSQPQALMGNSSLKKEGDRPPQLPKDIISKSGYSILPKCPTAITGPTCVLAKLWNSPSLVWL